MNEQTSSWQWTVSTGVDLADTPRPVAVTAVGTATSRADAWLRSGIASLVQLARDGEAWLLIHGPQGRAEVAFFYAGAPGADRWIGCAEELVGSLLAVILSE